MAMTAMSILICVIVLNLHHRDPNSPVPTWLRRLTHQLMAPVVCMQSVARRTTPRCNGISSPDDYQLCDFSKGYTMAMQNDNASLDIDCTSFDEYNNMNTRTDFGSSRRRRPKEQNGDTGGGGGPENSSKSALLEEVVRHLRRMTTKMKEKEEQDALMNDWKVAAKILDRFFLVLFVLFAVVASVTLLLIYPMFCKYLNEDID